MKKYIPTYHANSIFEITNDFYKKNNIKYLLLDLDNTLDSYKVTTPSSRVVTLINNLKKDDITPIIVSNNTSDRVKNYSKYLNIQCFSNMLKPFKHKLLKQLKLLNIPKENCLIIGDQIFTDIALGNSAKIRTLLTEKIVEEDLFMTHFNRLREKPLRARLKKCGKLNNWKNAL